MIEVDCPSVAKSYLALAKSVAETASKTKGEALPEVQL